MSVDISETLSPICSFLENSILNLCAWEQFQKAFSFLSEVNHPPSKQKPTQNACEFVATEKLSLCRKMWTCPTRSCRTMLSNSVFALGKHFVPPAESLMLWVLWISRSARSSERKNCDCSVLPSCLVFDLVGFFVDSLLLCMEHFLLVYISNVWQAKDKKSTGQCEQIAQILADTAAISANLVKFKTFKREKKHHRFHHSRPREEKLVIDHDARIESVQEIFKLGRGFVRIKVFLTVLWCSKRGVLMWSWVLAFFCDCAKSLYGLSS